MIQYKKKIVAKRAYQFPLMEITDIFWAFALSFFCRCKYDYQGETASRGINIKVQCAYICFFNSYFFQYDWYTWTISTYDIRIQ